MWEEGVGFQPCEEAGDSRPSAVAEHQPLIAAPVVEGAWAPAAGASVAHS